jgi:hypothetical protein
MAAMTLFAIGAAGVISMQRVTIQGGDDARRFDVGSNIAREWAQRLQRDAYKWTEPNSTKPGDNLDTATTWLHHDMIDGAWRVPDAPKSDKDLAGNSAAFDLLGRDIDPAKEDPTFCVQYKLDWIADPGPSPSKPTAVMRAQVRVYWSRLEFGPPNCADTKVYETADTRLKHHFVFLTTALRANPTE